MADVVRCRECDNKLDDYTPAPGAPPVPDAGSVSICFYCGAFAIYTGNGLELRAPTAEELAELEGDPQLYDLRRLIGHARSGR